MVPQGNLNIDNNLLRISSECISPSLCHIYNLSLIKGIVPVQWKTAKITPVYKGRGDHKLLGTISIVPTVAKVIEAYIKSKLISFLEINKLLCPTQFAYLNNTSTETALHNFIDNTLNNIDKGNISAACMLDLTKGFDTVCHESLLNKLQKYGIQYNILSWFTSYLSNRLQFVKYNNNISKQTTVTIGVPQGTILGPILFLIYINDFSNLSPDSTIFKYADDATIDCHSNNPSLLNTKMQLALSNTTEWLKMNRLVINPEKSTFIILGHKSKIRDINFSLHINGAVLPQCSSTKLLGIIIDEHLCWDSHIQHLLKKLSPKLGLLRRLSYIFPREVLTLLYLSIIQPHLDYCISIWGTCSRGNILTLQKIQNRAARIVTCNYDYSISSRSIIKDLGWMNIDQRHFYFTSILMYKSLNSLTSDTISNRFTKCEQIHNYFTRSSSNLSLHPPKPRTNYLKHCLSYNGVMCWNKLPLTIKNFKTFNSFKFACRKYILSYSSHLPL